MGVRSLRAAGVSNILSGQGQGVPAGVALQQVPQLSNATMQGLAPDTAVRETEMETGDELLAQEGQAGVASIPHASPASELPQPPSPGESSAGALQGMPPSVEPLPGLSPFPAEPTPVSVSVTAEHLEIAPSGPPVPHMPAPPLPPGPVDASSSAPMDEATD